MPILHPHYHPLSYNILLTFALGAVIGDTVKYYLGGLIAAYGVWAPLGVFAGMLLASAVSIGERPGPAQGLILLVGGGSRNTAPKAYQLHQPTLQRVWLVVTDRTAPVADDLKRQWLDTRCHRQTMENPLNPAKTSSAIQRAVDHARTLGVPPDGLICDVTGGITAMTVGALAGCLTAQVYMQMVPGSYDEVM